MILLLSTKIFDWILTRLGFGFDLDSIRFWIRVWVDSDLILFGIGLLLLRFGVISVWFCLILYGFRLDLAWLSTGFGLDFKISLALLRFLHIIASHRLS